jgi:hypothetical protein
MTEPKPPRKTPCASCPYRKSVPSGLWHESEYRKLERYDGETHEQQTVNLFSCHQGEGDICSGWLGHRDPLDMLAVRIGLSMGTIDGRSAEYTTTVPLFASGREAAEHGMQDIETPSDDAVEAIQKIVKKRGLAS